MGGKLIKSVVAALIALVILVVGGVGLMLLAFDPNQYKTALISAVQERYHRTLALPGTIELRLFPPFTLNTGPMRLSEPGSSALFAQASDMRLHLNLLALLQRQVVVDRIALDAPRIVVQRDAQGHFNFDDLLPKPGSESATPAAASSPAKAASPMGLQVRRLSIDGGDIALSDAKTGVNGHFTGLNLELTGLGEPSLTPLSLSARAVFTKPLLDANISLKGRLRAAPNSPVLLQDFLLRSDGQVLGIKKLLSNVSGSLSYTPASAAPPVVIGARAAEQPQSPTSSLLLQNLQIKAQGQNAQGQPLQFDAALPLLQWTGAHIELAALSAQALLGAMPGTWRIVLKAPATSGPAHALPWPGFELDVEQGQQAQTGAGLQAQLSGGLSLNLGAMSAVLNPARLQGHWRGASSAGGAGAKPFDFDLQGNLAYALPTSSSSFLLAGRAAQSQLKLSGSSLQRAITLNASADLLDLDALLGTHATVATPAAPGAAQATLTAPNSAPNPVAAASFKPTTPANSALLKALQAFDLNAQVQLGKLRFKGLQWSGLQAQVRDDRSTLTVAPFTMQGYGGIVSGSAQLQLADTQISLQQTLRNVQIQPIVQALSGHDVLLGTADAAWDLTMQGLTTPVLLRTLGGTAQFSVSRGALKGLNVEQSLRQASQLLRLRQDDMAPTSARQQTLFNLFDGHFKLARGVATSQDLKLQSPLLQVSGHGTIDLPAQTLDLLLRPTVTANLPGLAGPQAAVLKGLTVPVRISGAFAQPHYTVLWSQAAGGAMEALLKQRAEQELHKRLGVNDRQQLREKLQNKLKGLLR
jgi:AsmA protein